MPAIADVSDVLLLLNITSPTDAERAIVQHALFSAESAVKRHLRYDPIQAVRTEYYPNRDFTLSGRATVWEVDDQTAFVRRLAESAVDELQVRHLPVRQKDTDGANTIDLRLDYDGRSGTRSGSFAASSQLTEGTDFWPNYDQQDSSGYFVCQDGIIRSEGRWPQEPGSVKIVYLSGYTADELRGVDSVVDARPIYDVVVNEAVGRVHKTYSRSKHSRIGLGVGPLSSESLGDYSYSAATSVLQKLVGTDHDLMAESIIKLNDYVNYGVSLAS